MKTIPYQTPDSVFLTPHFQGAYKIIHKLKMRGYKAFIVGGFVRDLFLHNISFDQFDIDIVTSASPQEIALIFPKCNSVGEAFLINRIKIEKREYEVATFRKELGYFNSRHPKDVSVGTWQDDWERRDFTINSLYFDPIENLIYDPNGGLSDILRFSLKCIGNPHVRFEEDALRILRFFRFLVNLDFYPDKLTLNAIHKSVHLLKKISLERVQMEIMKVKPHQFQKFLYCLKLNRVGFNYQNYKLNHMDLFSSYKNFQKHFPISTLIFLGYLQEPLKKYLNSIPFTKQDKEFYFFILSLKQQKEINYENIKKLSTLLIKDFQSVLKFIIDISDLNKTYSLKQKSLQWYCRLQCWDQNLPLLDQILKIKVQWSSIEILNRIENLKLPPFYIGQAVAYQTNKLIWEPDSTAPWRKVDIVTEFRKLYEKNQKTSNY